MRKTIIAGNWKMNHLGADAKETIQGLVAKVPQDVKPEVIIAPVFPYLSMAVEMTKGTPIHVAAQNMHWEEKGAFTGEVSPAMFVTSASPMSSSVIPNAVPTSMKRTKRSIRRPKLHWPIT